jgi:hypothetical protein
MQNSDTRDNDLILNRGQLMATPNRHRCAKFRWLFPAFFILTAPPSQADLAMETETARILAPGHFEISTAFEFQSDPAGRSTPCRWRSRLGSTDVYTSFSYDNNSATTRSMGVAIKF